MKTDEEVLERAIDILEEEGAWCQGEFYRLDESGNKISFCAVGALAQAAAHWVYHRAFPDSQGRLVLSCPVTTLDSFGEAIREQVYRLCDRVAMIAGLADLSVFNDDPQTTSQDVVLAMKKTLEDLRSKENAS